MYRTIVEESPKNIAVMDVFSKLIQERTIFIDNVIDEDLANGVIAQLLYLDSLNDNEIKIYINSPGGNVVDGLAIYDVSKLIKSPIRTVCVGMAASMGLVLMLMGKTRVGLKHSKLMGHQPSGGAFGKFSDMKIQLEFMEELKEDLYTIIREKTIIEDVEDLFESDKWFNSKNALKCGILTQIL